MYGSVHGSTTLAAGSRAVWVYIRSRSAILVSLCVCTCRYARVCGHVLSCVAFAPLLVYAFASMRHLMREHSMLRAYVFTLS